MSKSLFQESETAVVPDKAMLANVLSYLKNRNLKETEEVLKRELSSQGGESISSLQVSAIGQSGTEPTNYEESYTRKAPLTSKTTAAPVQQLAQCVSTPTPFTTSVSPACPSTTPISSTQGNNTTTVFNKNPLWFQNPSVLSSSSPSECQPASIFAPRSLTPPSAGISLSPKIGGNGLILQNIPVSSGGSSLAVRPSLMYQLMSPPGVLTPILTVLPHSNGLVSSHAMLVDNLMPTQGQNFAIESLISKLAAQSETEKVRSNSFSDEVFVKADRPTEPATGQVILPQDLSLVSSSSSSSPHPHTLASIPHLELTPQHLELKAFAEDFKTRRIRLGFTQGTVGQSLSERGYSNFAQSTISRFEQMQLSPSNAATIRVILEKWLLEAESPEPVTTSAANSSSQMAGRKRKKRAVFAPQTKSVLDEFFSQNCRPNRQAIESISQKLDLLPEEVRVWFCNKRQKSKPHSTSGWTPSSYDRESSHSATSSMAPSPSPSEGSGLMMKRRSPSPSKMPFTIEELSKSSSTSSSTVRLSTSSVANRMGLVAPSSSSVTLPILFNSSTKVFSNPILPQAMPYHVAQTRA